MNGCLQGKVHQRSRELLKSVYELCGRKSEGPHSEEGRTREADRKWAEIERFLALVPPALPEVLKDGWCVGLGRAGGDGGRLGGAGASNTAQDGDATGDFEVTHADTHTRARRHVHMYTHTHTRTHAHAHAHMPHILPPLCEPASGALSFSPFPPLPHGLSRARVVPAKPT